MGSIADSANNAYRDYVTNNLPASGVHQPEKPDIRALFVLIDALIGAGFLPRGEYDVATVYNKRDIVTYNYSSWVYHNDVSSAGNPPPTLPDQSNDHWQLISAGSIDVASLTAEVLAARDGAASLDERLDADVDEIDERLMPTSAFDVPGVGYCKLVMVDANDKPFFAIDTDNNLWAAISDAWTQVGGAARVEEFLGGDFYEGDWGDRQPWLYADYEDIILMFIVLGQSLGLGSNPDEGAEFTGSIAGTTLTVSAVASGAITVGKVITGAGVTAGTKIVDGAGLSWTVSISQTVASTAMSIAVDTARSTVALYPDNALMFDAGVVPDEGETLTSFEALVEADGPGAGEGGSIKETICSGFAEVVLEKFETAFGFKPTILMTVAAHGGTPYRGLQRGTDTDTEMVRQIQRAVEIAGPLGKRIIVPAVIIQHGEADNANDVSREQYSRMLTQWRINTEATIRAITGQYEPVRALIPQCNRRSDSASKDSRTPWAALIASRMDPHITCVGPIYDAMGDSTQTHPYSWDYERMGRRYGFAAFDEIFDVGYQPLHAVRCWQQTSGTFRIQYNKPVTVDTSGAIINTTLDISANRGFLFADAAASGITVTGVALVGGTDDTIELTLSGAFSGFDPRFLYATYSTAASMGRVNGPRGCIRAATSWGNDANGEAVYDWACTETIRPGMMSGIQ